MNVEIKNLGMLILAGGKSSRMGSDKALLRLGSKAFLELIVEKVTELSEHIAVSVAGGQKRFYKDIFKDNPAFQSVLWVEDSQMNLGPMSGIAEGLKTLEGKCSYAFVTGCDVPVIKLELVRHLYQVAVESDATAVVPVNGKRIYGMTAIYQTAAWKVAQRLLDDQRLRVSELASELQAKRLELSKLEHCDVGLESFVNINSPEDYEAYIQSRRLD